MAQVLTYMNNLDKEGVPFDVKGGKYHAVWVWIVLKDGKSFWGHHYSASSRSDARDEAASCRRNGEKTKIVRQNW